MKNNDEMIEECYHSILLPNDVNNPSNFSIGYDMIMNIDDNNSNKNRNNINVDVNDKLAGIGVNGHLSLLKILISLFKSISYIFKQFGLNHKYDTNDTNYANLMLIVSLLHQITLILNTHDILSISNKVIKKNIFNIKEIYHHSLIHLFAHFPFNFEMESTKYNSESKQITTINDHGLGSLKLNIKLLSILSKYNKYWKHNNNNNNNDNKINYYNTCYDWITQTLNIYINNNTIRNEFSSKMFIDLSNTIKTILNGFNLHKQNEIILLLTKCIKTNNELTNLFNSE